MILLMLVLSVDAGTPAHSVPVAYAPVGIKALRLRDNAGRTYNIGRRIAKK
jgi:hypothetical protein